MRTITCFGDRTCGTFLITALVSDEDNLVLWTDNFVNVNYISLCTL